MRALLILISLLLVGCATAPTYKMSYIDKNTANITSSGYSKEYADDCFMIASADFAKLAGASYFIITNSDSSIDNYSISTVVPVNNVPYPVVSTSNSSTYYKNGVVRVFKFKPKSDYVVSYNADATLRKYHYTYQNLCRTGKENRR